MAANVPSHVLLKNCTHVFFKPLETYNCIFPVGLKKAKLFKHLNIKKGFAFGRIDQIAY
jgi:hypothetical protein